MAGQRRYRVLLFLLIPLLLLAAAIAWNVFHVRSILLRDAIQDAEVSARHISDEAEWNFISAKTAVDNYLALYSYRKTRGSVVYPSFDERDVSFITEDNVYSSLEGFVLANPKARSAGFVLEKNTELGSVSGGFAPFVYRESLEHRNLAVESDILSSELYLKGKSVFEPFLSSPVLSGRDSAAVITYVQPVYDRFDSLRVVTQIWVELDLDALSEVLRAEKTFDDSRIFALTRDFVVIADDSGRYPGRALERVLEENPDLGACLSAEKMDVFRNPDFVEDVTWTEGKYITTVCPVEGRDFLLVMMRPKASVFRVLHVTFAILSISLLAVLLLMMLCSMLVFRSFLKEDRIVSRTEHELDISAGIQSGFLPGNSLQLENLQLYATTRPAAEVGGDFFDYVRKDGKLYFCLGDVSGKSIPAALFMSMTDSLFRTAVRLARKPEEIASIMNSSLVERNEEMMFCTAFIGVIDPESGQISFCNAGHNPPLAAGIPESDHFIKVIPNRPLGLVDGVPFEAQADYLLPGQALFVYSDGVTEARSRGGEYFGNDRLLEAVALDSGTPRRLVEKVQESVDAFAQGAPQSDAITMLCIR